MNPRSTRGGLIALVYALPSSRRPRFRERTGRRLRMSGMLAVAAVAIAGLIGSAQALAQNAYITNGGDNTVSVIATATNTVTATIPVGNAPGPVAISQSQSPPKFAGTPGFSNCQGQSVAALANQPGGIDAAAAALGYTSVKALQNAIKAFCRA
jgi:YVTN family beta-propeller protein